MNKTEETILRYKIATGGASLMQMSTELCALCPFWTITEGQIYNTFVQILRTAKSSISAYALHKFLYERLSLGDGWAKAVDKAKYVFEAEEEL